MNCSILLDTMNLGYWAGPLYISKVACFNFKLVCTSVPQAPKRADSDEMPHFVTFHQVPQLGFHFSNCHDTRLVVSSKQFSEPLVPEG